MAHGPWEVAEVPPSPPAYRVPETFRTAAITGRPSYGALLDLLLKGSDAPGIDTACNTLASEFAVSGEPAALFRAGVAQRMRYDGPRARPGDFQAAAEAWQVALGG